MVSQWLHNIGKLLYLLEQTTDKPGDLTSTLQHIVQTAQEFFAADACVIFITNPLTGRFIRSFIDEDALVTTEWTPHNQLQPERIAPKVIKHNLLLIEDLEKQPEFHSAFTLSAGIHSFAALTLGMRHDQKPMGILYLDFTKPQKFTKAGESK